MSFNDLYNKVYREILFLSGEFDIRKVYSISLNHCPKNFTEERVKMLVVSVMNELLNRGLVKVLKNGMYETAIESAKRNNIIRTKEVENV